MRPAILIGVLLCIASAGCVRRAEADGVVTFTPHWAEMLLPATIGLGLLALGVPIVTGRLPIGRGKPTVLGSLLTMMGLFFFLGAVLTYPFERVAVGPKELVIAEGVLGKGASQTVDLTALDAIEFYPARRSLSGGRDNRLATIMRCHAKNGETEEIVMEGELREAALPTAIKQARELGMKVIDHTTEESK